MQKSLNGATFKLRAALFAGYLAFKIDTFYISPSQSVYIDSRFPKAVYLCLYDNTASKEDAKQKVN